MTDLGEWKVYKKRWFMLFCAFIANIASGILWMTYSTVTDVAAKYYDVSQDMINQLPTAVFVASLLVGILAMLILDRKNLKIGIRLGTFLITLGYGCRILPVFIDINNHQAFYFALAGHILIGCGIPFIAFIPSKLAEHWFSENEKLYVISLVSLGNPIGLMLSDLLIEKLLKTNFDISYSTLILGSPALIAFLLSLIINESRPPTPPNGIAAIVSQRPFLPGIKQLFKQLSFLVLFFYIGSVIGSIFSMLTITRQLVLAHSLYFSGVFGGILIGCGILGTCVSTILVKKLNSIVLVMKLAVAGHCICITMLYLELNYSFGFSTVINSNILLLLLSGLSGFFGFMVIPLGLDLASDCSFPNCTEAASNGLLLISGYMQSLFFIGIMRFFAIEKIYCKGYGSLIQPQNSFLLSNEILIDKSEFYEKSNCHTFIDYSRSLTIQTGLMTIIGSLFIGFFETEYRRMNTNRKKQVNRILGLEDTIEIPASIYS